MATSASAAAGSPHPLSASSSQSEVRMEGLGSRISVLGRFNRAPNLAPAEKWTRSISLLRCGDMARRLELHAWDGLPGTAERGRSWAIVQGDCLAALEALPPHS